MKKVIHHIIAIIVLLLATTSCTDVLDQKALDSFNEQAVFSDVKLVKAFLGDCYDKMGGDGGVLGLREDLLCSMTDQNLCIHRPASYNFVKGNLTPDALGHISGTRMGFLNWQRLYSNIQNLNILLANIDDVPTATPAEAELLDQVKGEAYFIRAYDYALLLMAYGGVVISEQPFMLGQDYLTITRSTLQETLDFILSDIDNALALLPETDIEQGRATRGTVAALKSRLLLFCASELTNGGYEPANPLVSFTTGTQASRWMAARDAAKAIIDGTYGTYALHGTTADPPSPLTQEQIQAYADNYNGIFMQTGDWNEETIWGVQYTQLTGNTQRVNVWNGTNGYHNWGNNEPTEPAVRSFEMDDGSPFVWDNGDGENYRKATTAELAADPLKNPFNGREPRFYAIVLFHGARFQPRPDDMAGVDPVGIIQTGSFYNIDGSVFQYGIDTRQALVGNWNGTKTGYNLKKLQDINALATAEYYDNVNAWIEFRYAEILLNYAEACIELGGTDLQDGINALNLVRNRAGLPDRATSDQTTARDFVRHERAIELFAEGHRWYDIRRWMICEDVIKTFNEMKVKEYVNGGPDDLKFEWIYDTNVKADSRSFDVENYWLPIRRVEINRAPQIVQNPNYD